MTTPKSSTAATIFHGLDREQLIRIAETLEAENQIGYQFDRPIPNEHTIRVRTDAIHLRLVQLYTNLFTTHWSTFKSTHAQMSHHTGVPPPKQLAITYVSAWFYDLYVTNRECTRRISSEVFSSYYHRDVNYIAGRYDPFLQHLNSIIRPTRITTTTEDALYFPYFRRSPTFNTPHLNILDITGASINTAVLKHLLNIFDDPRNEFSTVPLATHVYGRPGWLFDFRLGEAFAWFPMENNYSYVDLVAPHILGIPCSPRLGPCDIDDSQLFNRTVLPEPPYNMALIRKTPRKFHGSAEYETIETYSRAISFQQFLEPNKEAILAFHARATSREALDIVKKEQEAMRQKQLALSSAPTQPEGSAVLDHNPSDSSSSSSTQSTCKIPDLTLHTYRIRNWCYHAKIVFGKDSQTINKAFRTFILRGNDNPST